MRVASVVTPFIALAVAACAMPLREDPVSLKLGTATPGGGFVVYGEAFKAAVQQADPNLTILPRNTAGSVENANLLDTSQLDLGLVLGEAAHEQSLKRVGAASMRPIWAMYSSPGMFVVKADSPYRTIADLKGQPVVFGARGSGFVLLAGYVLASMGLDRDRDFKAIYLERAADGPVMLADGRAVAIWGGGANFPPFNAALKAPGGARFIAPSSAEIGAIVAKHKFLRPITVPAGSYPGQAQAIASVGSWGFVYSRPDLPDDTAYRLARALHKAEASFGARLPQAGESTAANTVAAGDRNDLHPGVVRYLRENNLLK